MPNEIDFCSNDYLGLSRQVAPSNFLRDGAGGSRLLSGHHPVHQEAEEYLARLFEAEASLLFANGYMANMGLLSAIATRHDTFLYDEAIHASMREGIRMSSAASYSFCHGDLAHLEEKMEKAKGEIFVCTEGLFSMDGDWSDLKNLVRLVETHGAYLIVDEAHSTGIIGPSGAGWVVQNQLQDRVLARVHTFGKAAGRSGAVVVGSQVLKDYLINRSRTFIYTTAPSPSETSSWLDGVHRMALADESRSKLWENVTLFHQVWKEAGLPQLSSVCSPIISVVIPGNTRVRALANSCQKKGFDVRAILSPTVAEGSERIRIVLHSFNTDQEIRGLVSSLQQGLIG